MRLRQLDLRRYGHLSDVCLDFPSGTALHVVYGANEAGKSTALAAIADALFGFPHRTPFDFLHGSAQLRIGFSLTDEDGAEAKFVRRKGIRDTLLDSAGQPVPEQALRRFLGGTDRSLFEVGFGLDGARLRQGARELQASAGDAGSSLLSGSGLLNLRGVLKNIDEQAKALFGDGRGRRKLSEALEAFRQARDSTDESAVPPRAWKEQEDARTKAVSELRLLQEEIRALTTEMARLERQRRVAPILAAIDIERDTAAKLAHAPQMPLDAELRRERALAADRDALRDAEREANQAVDLELELANLVPDGAVLGEQDAIDALEQRRGVAQQASLDRPGVIAQAKLHRAAVQAALAELPTDLTPEAARDAVPLPGLRQRVQRLITRHGELSAKALAADRALAAAQRRLDAAQAALAASPPPPAPQVLRRTIDDLRAEGRLDDDLASAAASMLAAKSAAAAALANLPLWSGDLAELRACRLPLPAAIAASTAHLDDAALTHNAARSAVTELDAELTTRRGELSRLSAGEAVPTPAAITEARGRRDQLWQQLRQRLEGVEPESSSPGPLLVSFEGFRDDADRLADRRFDDARRVTDYLNCEARLDFLQTQRPDLVGQRAAAERQELGALEAWRHLWAQSGVQADSPAVMAEWCRQREQVLAKADTATEAAARHTELTERRDRALSALDPLLPAAALPRALAAALRQADAACAADEAALHAHTELEATAKRLAEPIPELKVAADEAASAFNDWQANWMEALAALALPVGQSVDATEAALAAWARIAEVAEAWRADETRMTAMSMCLDAFEVEVSRLQNVLGEAVAGEPPAQIAARLARRLAGARDAAAKANDLAGRIAKHRAAAKAAEHLRAEAAKDLAELRELAGVADDAVLASAIEDARRRDEALAEMERLARNLAAQGDGQNEEMLRSEAVGFDVDAATARLAEIIDQQHRLGEQREKLSAVRTLAEQQIDAMLQGRDAASKAQEAADALAAARTAAERYARLHVARSFLQAGMEGFRRNRQGPLLRAAGTHFASLTGGRYKRLGADEDQVGQVTLHAVRDDDSECPMEALSEGTRDQLYLALRIAGVEAHVAQATPMPFIADDLLVHFDDRRAAAAIASLAELGRTTQVILFTHHEHVVTLAAQQAGVGLQYLP